MGMEALMRWEHNGRSVSPAEFIPVAENKGLIIAMGDWSLRKACEQARFWPPHLRLTVNLSATQIYAPHLVDTLASILEETGFAPERLELDIPETVILKNADITLARLRRLKALGVTLVLDDFGKGDVSLISVSRYPIDKIKIDHSVLEQSRDADRARMALTATITLASALGLGVIAEGIENSSDLDAVGRFTQIHGQGYFLCRPRPADELLSELGEAGLTGLRTLSNRSAHSRELIVAAE